MDEIDESAAFRHNRRDKHYKIFSVYCPPTYKHIYAESKISNKFYDLIVVLCMCASFILLNMKPVFRGAT